MTYTETADMIKRHEGYSDRIYLDSKGIPTGGWGHAFLPGSNLPLDIALRLFKSDFDQAIDDYESLGLDLDSIRRAVVIDMLFNLGLPKFMGFKKFIAALRAENWKIAAAEMKDSLWYRQTKERARELVGMMIIGENYV